MEIKKGWKSLLPSIENDETKSQHLLAFCDFCRDLLEEQYGKISSDEEVNPRFVKGLPICT
jgi:hypothetical protein